ncbi:MULTISPECIES: cobalamin-dependent protein [unclassified Streptomyces]|uniref:cobalamin B12-binding domain-containing protein n=1 Tax=unclassified Streptomyces TaxID=2593676 RepID=UPI000DB9E916|nr:MULTISPECIES: cobalamin-dependent protein [unclassified Streptomyces]MYT68175.1 cobalamin-binding protein [Streptomyces sp. SID8367]RAJ72743.1 methanogenic corrinoid protein MtbC1 [Streptomyces sp. PsTaAH-137]
MTTSPSARRHEQEPAHRIGARAREATGSERAQPWADKLWNAVRSWDEYDALDVVRGALDAGLEAESVLLDVIGAAQHHVGIEWAANRMSVADEHTATAINERAVAALPTPRPADERGRITVACVDEEWHALPARMLAETLKLRGWRVDYLGAQVPTGHLVSHITRSNPDLVCLSSSIPTRLPMAHQAITACQGAGVPVMAGGAAFGHDGRYARILGADTWASEARSAADQLAHALPTRPQVPRLTVNDLPHLEDQEYTYVSRSSVRLLAHTFDGLEERFPAMKDYSDDQRERTEEDLGQIIDFLTAALYMNEADIFTGFLAWTAEILEVRHVPARSMLPALDLLAEQLRDYPRALHILHAGKMTLASAN